MFFMFLQKCKIKRSYSSLQSICYLNISHISDSFNFRSQQLGGAIPCSQFETVVIRARLRLAQRSKKLTFVRRFARPDGKLHYDKPP